METAPSVPSHPSETATPGRGAMRRLAFDRTLPPPEALGRIRDAFQDYDQQGGIM